MNELFGVLILDRAMEVGSGNFFRNSSILAEIDEIAAA